jgi:hypothetical protein
VGPTRVSTARSGGCRARSIGSRSPSSISRASRASRPEARQVGEVGFPQEDFGLGSDALQQPAGVLPVTGPQHLVPLDDGGERTEQRVRLQAPPRTRSAGGSR